MPNKKKSDRLILAMDLSLSGSAFAVLEVYLHSVRIKELRFVDNDLPEIKNKSHGDKLANIYFNLEDILQKHHPTDLVREKGFSRFPLATQALFKVVGVVDFTMYCCDLHNNIEEIAPTSVKKLVTGSGKASKEEVDIAVRKFISPTQQDIVFQTNDLSDAVAVGVAYCLKNKIITPVTND